MKLEQTRAATPGLIEQVATSEMVTIYYAQRAAALDLAFLAHSRPH